MKLQEEFEAMVKAGAKCQEEVDFVFAADKFFDACEKAGDTKLLQVTLSKVIAMSALNINNPVDYVFNMGAEALNAIRFAGECLAKEIIGGEDESRH